MRTGIAARVGADGQMGLVILPTEGCSFGSMRCIGSTEPICSCVLRLLSAHRRPRLPQRASSLEAEA